MQILLSAASAEFETYRGALEGHLTAHGRSVVIQEGFVASGTPTLDKLARYVAECDVVVHLIGDLAGAMARDRSIEALLAACPDIGARFPVLQAFLAPGGPSLSYTQWEAWLALYYGKRVFVAAPVAKAPRGPRHAPPSDADRASQAAHRARLASQECHVEIEFESVELLAIALHKALAAEPMGAAKPCDIPPAAGHFVGRADALSDLVKRLRAGRDAAVVGSAGFGKTALAAAALRRIVGDGGERIANSPWPDGLVLLDLYVHRGQAEAAWHALANRVEGVEFLRDRSGRDRAMEALRDRRLLVVVEGAEQADGLEGRVLLADLQQPLGNRVRWLILTRLLKQADPARRVWLQDRLSDEEAGELLDELTRISPLPSDVRNPLLELLQGHPLALTWAGGLMARGDEDPHWLLREWQAGQLPSLADPTQDRHTLAWLFDRSVSRLDDGERDVLSVAARLAPTPVPLPAFVAALGREEITLRAGLRGLVQHGLMRFTGEAGQVAHWQFAHVLAYGHARERCLASPGVPLELASWLMQTLQVGLGRTGARPDAEHVAACLEHAGALLKADAEGRLWAALLIPLLYDVHDRLVSLGWSVQAQADLAAVTLGMEALPPSHGATLLVEHERERAVIANRRADLFMQRGDLASAEQAYRAALAVRERLAAEDPGNVDRQRNLSISHDNIGKVLNARGDMVGAERAHRASLAVAEQLVAIDPSNARWQRDLAISHMNIGRLLSAQGNLTGAERAYRASLARSEDLARSAPGDVQLQRDVSISLDGLGRVLHAQGNLTGAEQAYRGSLAVAERLVHSDPNNVEWQRDLSVSQNNVGTMLSAQGDLAGAEQAFRAGLIVRERLAKADPSNALWQRDLSVSQEYIGRALRSQGDLAGAEAAQRASLKVRERLAAADPSNAQWQRDLTVSQESMSRILREQGDLAGAEQLIRMALAIRVRLAASDPSNTQWQRDANVCLSLIGTLRQAQGDLHGAEEAFRATLAVCDRLAKADPSNAQWQHDWSCSQSFVGMLLSAQGDLPGAEQAHRAAVVVRERLTNTDPSNAEWQRDLSYTYTAIAEILEQTGNVGGALETARLSLAIDERLAALDPRNATWQIDVRVSRAMVERLGG